MKRFDMIICNRDALMKSFFVSVCLLFIVATGCTPYFTRHYEDSFFSVGRNNKFSVEIVTGKKDLKIDASTVGIIVHDANDKDVEQADVSATAIILENGRQKEVICTVTEKGRGLYIIESLDLRQAGLSRLDITIKKDGVGDIAVLDFAEKKQIREKH